MSAAGHAPTGKGTVLLVEDERDTRELLAGAIARAGYRCATAASVAEALARAADAGFIDVVVTDVVLGADDRGGLHLMGELKAAGILAPVIVITAYADVEKVKIALNEGAAHLLEKPFRAAALLDGLSSGEIAELEHNSPKTIRQHVSTIYAKCGVGSRAEFFRLVYAR